MDKRQDIEDIEAFVKIVEKKRKEEAERNAEFKAATGIEINRFTLIEEEQEDNFNTPTYCYVEPQEKNVIQSKQYDDEPELDFSRDFKFDTKEKLRLLGVIVLAGIVGFGLLKFGQTRDKEVESFIKEQYSGYIETSKENNLPISEEGLKNYINYNYTTNTVDIEGNSIGGR